MEVLSVVDMIIVLMAAIGVGTLFLLMTMQQSQLTHMKKENGSSHTPEFI
ncbi:hypothetical protein KG089_02510 [Carnobacteriaceae bacterium zg-ZUI252]|nr:hypothetical protein [Carnobacteriaceae bacterium zg-ZUI252]MBS4770244.1 hypothetical protein [Carnobacteriaceae bacterium zg-ZUI240]QTU83398.1 hypothetical protein J7S27_02450 [Carnobacteriaceae bacterium zg-C25]